jgi:hypothetical protein
MSSSDRSTRRFDHGDVVFVCQPVARHARRPCLSAQRPSLAPVTVPAIKLDPMIPSSTHCVWGCGRSSLNAEHVIGKQFARRMDLPRPLVLRWGDYGRQQETLEIVLRDRVCDVCNGHWMKKLDDQVRKLMGPSIVAGESITITSKAKHCVLARWSMKVALLLTLWFHDEAVRDPKLVDATMPGHLEHPRPLPYAPVDDFSTLHGRGRPSDRAMIWFGAADRPVPFFMVTNPLRARTGVGSPVGRLQRVVRHAEPHRLRHRPC